MLQCLLVAYEEVFDAPEDFRRFTCKRRAEQKCFVVDVDRGLSRVAVGRCTDPRAVAKSDSIDMSSTCTAL